MKPRPHPPALPHGELREVFPGIFFVTGTIGMPGPLPIRFSRNMTVVRDGERLVLVNSVRLTEAGLRKLDELGRVTDVVRLAGFHGSDDAFYKERYGAAVSAIKGQRYTAGFGGGPDTEPYFEPDVEIEPGAKLPIPDSSLYSFSSNPPEALLLLEREGGIVISGDCLQNWAKADEYFSWLGKLMMKAMGFIKPHNIGPGWLKQAKPPATELRRVLDLEFEHVLPAHGAPVVGGAKAAYAAAIETAAGAPSRHASDGARKGEAGTMPC